MRYEIISEIHTAKKTKIIIEDYDNTSVNLYLKTTEGITELGRYTKEELKRLGKSL